MKPAIYVRVSTEGQTHEQQAEACRNYCKIKEWPDPTVFSETESSMKYRPVFEDVLRRCRAGEYSHLIVYRLDRAWRSSRQFIIDFDSLQSRGVSVISVMESLDPTTPMGKAMMTILVALAELERTNISQATKDRLQALKNLGKTLGRPQGSQDKKPRRKSGYFLRHGRKA